VPRGIAGLEVLATATRLDLDGADREEVTLTLQIGDDTAIWSGRLTRRAPRMVYP
jgi:hypothetical protein